MHCLFNSIERTIFYSWTCATSLKLDSTYKICWLDLFLFFFLQCWGLDLGPCIHWASALPQNNISKQFQLFLIVGQFHTVTGRIPVSFTSQPSLLSPSLSPEPPPLLNHLPLPILISLGTCLLLFLYSPFLFFLKVWPTDFNWNSLPKYG